MSKNLISIDFSPKFFYIIAFIIFSIIEQILWKKANKKLNFVKEKNSKFNELTKEEKYSHILILTSLSLIKSIDLIIYYIIKTKFNRSIKETNKKEILQIPNAQIKKNKKDENTKKNFIYAFMIIIICEIIFFSLSSMRFFFGYSTNYKKNIINIYINLNSYIFALILGYFLFKENFHNHHKLALIFIFISDIILLISQPIYNEKNNFFLKIIYNLYYFYIKTFLFNLIIVKLFLEKYVMHNYYLNQYLIIGYEGLIGIFISIFIILIQINFYGGKYLKDFAKDLYSNLYFYLLVFNSYFLINIEITINFQFNPSYVLLSSNYFMFEDFYKIFTGKFNSEKSYSFFIKDILILFAILIFSEIIIINRFELEKFTKKEIEKRAINDTRESLNELYEK